MVHNFSNGKPLVGNDRYSGYCKDLAQLVSEKIGFDYRIKEVADGLYGTANDNGTSWDGMIGELLREVSNS